ncbi:PKD domain-containing protein [Candidatus Gracilibacteria bacterium]|nr:PKD domain-containing protein [Candidatus Gracilibacteria bacterium]
MRKSYFFLLAISIAILVLGLSKGDTYAACGGGWFNTNCATTPYDCVGPKCGIEGGTAAVKQAVNGQITSDGIVVYAQKIVTYLMSFISIIAVIYIIYAGFQLMIGAGDEEKMKKTRQIIIYVIAGILVMWLAYPIVKWTTKLILVQGNIIPYATAAYTESDNDTFVEYKTKIREGLSQMESELMLNKSVSVSTIQNVKNLVQAGFDRLPDYGEAASVNKEAKQLVDTYLGLAIQNPTNSNHVGNAISRVASFLDRANIGRITGSINAGPAEGNAPLSVSFRADNIKDPSGTTPNDNNYIWWTRENGGVRRELSRGPSLSYTFTKEGTYTVFLDVVSGSRNSKGKIDVLPLSVSKEIVVKPKLGEIILLINGVNASNMDKIKISPNIGKMGVILDASASRAIGNGTIAETKWEFGNGESSTNRGGPIVERQLYSNQGGYIVKLTIKTNDGQTFTKELQLLLLDPSATIKLDKNTGHIGEDISMSATTFFSDNKNVEYSWQIQDESGNKVVKTGEGTSFRHKFDVVGSYIVTLTSKSPNGNVDTDSKIITIESREPVVTIDTPRPIKTEKPNTIVFDATKSYDPDTNSRKNLSYTWKIDGEKITLDNIENDGAKGTYTFENKGKHSVSVTVGNVFGKITTVENQFEVLSTLSVNMISTPRVVKRGEPVTIIGQSANAEFFEWNTGDGSPAVSGTNRSIQHIYKQSGTYDVRLNVNRDGASETNTITRKVYVTDTDSPFAIIDATNASSSITEEIGVCNGNNALIINRADVTTFNSTNSVNIDGTTNGLTYTWKYFGKAKTTPSISEKFNELGCFPIELTVRSSKNGATHTTTQYIKLTNKSPELTSLSATVDTAKKDSQKILVKVKANGAIDPDGVITSYIWYFKTDSDPEPQNVQITQKDEITFVLPNITEKYYFGVILEDNDGAKIDSTETGKSSTPLIVDNSNGNIHLPLITLTTPKTVLNVGEKARFSVDVKTIIPGINITNKSEYGWDFDGDGRIDEKSSVPSIEHTYMRSGDFNMKVRVTNNGVSNSKYQTIHVKNKLTANVEIYKLPDGRTYLMNTSDGVYDKANWEVGTITSETLSSLLLDASITPITGKLTVSNTDSDVASVDIDFSKAEAISGTGILYQSFPRSNNDIITVKNPNDAIMLSMYGNIASNFAIDTDIAIDTNLDGTVDNDIDNKDDASYSDGSAYRIFNIGDNTKREHKIKLALIQDGKVISTRIVTIVFDYISDTIESNLDLSGSGVTGLSVGDRAKLEELSKMIRELKDSDRIILMQRYNILVENWNNPFDKAKSLIDIQEGIEGGNFEEEMKVKMSKVIDELLVGDAEVTDEIGIAALLIRDLIPKESPNQAELLAKLSEIESHPTLLDTNKKLGKEMLVLIETDSTIPDKYKGHIKNQLLVIINGGSKSIQIETETPEKTPEVTTSNGIMGFISGFVKIFFIIVGIILLIGILAFVFYRITRKGDTIGFQDFLIDSVFHNKPSAPPVSEKVSKSNVVVEGAPPLPKEDPLSSYTPVITKEPEPIVTPVIEKIPSEKPSWIEDPLGSPVIKEEVISPISEKNEVVSENIPDWLKAPMSQMEENKSVAVPIPEAIEPSTIESLVPEELPQEVIDTKLPKIESSIPESTPLEDSIPDWLKNTSITEESIPETKNEAATNSKETTEDKLPDWLISSLQSEESIGLEAPVIEEKKLIEAAPRNLLDLKNEDEEIPKVEKVEKKSTKKPKTTTGSTQKKEVKESTADKNSTENIPDWLK